jgi:hypothetical protein
MRRAAIACLFIGTMLSLIAFGVLVARADVNSKMEQEVPKPTVWRIIVTIMAPRVGPVVQFTYGKKGTDLGVFLSEAACQKVLAGSDKAFEKTRADMKTIIKQAIAPDAVPIYECVEQPVKGEKVD